MKRRIAMALMAGMLTVFAGACGSDAPDRERDARNAQAEKEQDDNEHEETDREETGGEISSTEEVETMPSGMEDEVSDRSDLYEICLFDDGAAEFIFHAGLAEGPEVKEVVYTVDRYEVAFFNYNDEPQCQLMEKGEGVSDLIACPDYELRGSDIVMVVKTDYIPKVDLGELQTCSVYYTYGSDEYIFSELKMSDILTEGSNTANAEGTPETGGKTEGSGKQVQTYWFMNQVLSSHGGSWGASHIELSDPDENGFPTVVTVTDSGVDAMGNPLDGVYHIIVDQYEADEGMDYVIGRYAGALGAGIKGMFYDAAGNGLTLQID